jgi:hypothetical protein
MDWPTRVRTLVFKIWRENLYETASLSSTRSGVGRVRLRPARPDDQGLFSWMVEPTDRLRIWLPRCGFKCTADRQPALNDPSVG